MQDPKTETSVNQLVPVQNALTEFEKVSAGLVELTRKYANVVYPVTTTKGMDEAKAARLEIRSIRYAVQRAEKAASEELNGIKRNVKDRAEQIITVLGPLELAIDTQIKVEEDRKAEAKRLKEEAEAARVAALRDRVAAIAAMPAAAAGQDAEEIKAILDQVAAIDIDASWEEFTPHAADAKDKAVSALITLHASAVAAAEARAQLAAQQAELERQRQQIEAQRRELEEARSAAEAARIAEQQAREEAFARSEAARIAAEQEASRLAGAQQGDAFELEQEQERVRVLANVAQSRADLRHIAGEYKRMGVVAPEQTKVAPFAPQEQASMRAPEDVAQVAPEFAPQEMSVEMIELSMPGAPSGVEIVIAVADYYGVSLEMAWQWIQSIDANEINSAIAEAA